MQHQVAAEAIASRLRQQPFPQDLVILGSGLGRFGENLEARHEIAYEDVPHFPTSTVSGHAGRLIIGTAAGRPLACMQGRMHYYEGYSAEQIAVPIRAFAHLGVKRILMTNAAGGIGEHLHPGDLMVIDDHINLTGRNPLVGPEHEALGPRFPDMSQAWDPALREGLREAGATSGVALKAGIYVQVLGPSFETPAEIRMLGRLGADAVGMSTVPECIVARSLGIRVAGLSLITNYAAGRVPDSVLTLEETMDEAALAYERVRDLLLAYYAAPVTDSTA
jgi:inosine/guanosine/xanthosine phosphorylase family protein